MIDFKNKKITVMGLGLLGGGVGTAEFFCKKGAHVTVTDLKDERELSHSLQALSSYPVKYVLGRHEETDFSKTDLVIRNPAIPLDSPYLQIARDHKVPIEMAESLFLKLSPTKKIIGITGTRGKSTTSAMVHHILKEAGRDSHLAGNQKNTATLKLLHALNASSYVVLELSSWQLESFAWSRISPPIAVVTNIYPDHLNRYISMEEYIAAKSHLFRYQSKSDQLFLNKKDEQCKLYALQAQSNVNWYSDEDLPASVKLNIPGVHNRSNASAAYAVSQYFSIEDSITKKALESFQGLPGRLETLGTLRGITIVNDTTSTTPTAGIRALHAFPEKKTVLLIGGTSKNLPTDELVRTIKRRAKALVLLGGGATDEIMPKLALLKLPMKGPYASLTDALREGMNLARKGDIVLFSPSFPSFAHFNNEFHRGEAFNHAFSEAK